MKILLTSAIICLLLMTGCDKPGPIELVDTTGPAQSIQIDTTTQTTTTLDATSSDIDSAGLFASTGGNTFGQILIGGARYDAENEQHNASIAQVLFFDKALPLVLHGDTLSYMLQPAGDIRVNGLLLARHSKRFRLTASADTVLGMQYSLYNKDGVGGRGFQYNGNVTIQISGSGTSGFPAFMDTIITPPVLRVFSPSAGDEFDPQKNLRISFIGNAENISIFVRVIPLNGSIIDTKPILKLKSKRQGNGITIPSTILRMLPRGQNEFVFSFMVENTRITRISGFAGDVLFSASYVHHIVLKAKR